MRKTFKYRLYPNAAQQELLRVQLSEACRLYNAALQERRDAYKSHGKSLDYYDQANQLKEIRASGNLGLANYHCCQEVLKRVHKAFDAFFRRIKRKQRAGYPRFKSHRRYDSITFPSHGDGNKLLKKRGPKRSGGAIGDRGAPLQVFDASVGKHGVEDACVERSTIGHEGLEHG